MKITEIQEMSLEDFRGLSPIEQKRAVSQLASAYNKRIRRLEAREGGKASPAYQSRVVNIAEQGLFSVKGKSGKALQKEFIRAKAFGELKTATGRGLEHYEKTVLPFQDRAHGGNVSKSLANEAWGAFAKVKEAYPNLFTKDNKDTSDKILKYLKRDVVGDKKYNTFTEGEIERELMDYAKSVYEGDVLIDVDEDETPSEYML